MKKDVLLSVWITLLLAALVLTPVYVIHLSETRLQEQISLLKEENSSLKKQLERNTVTSQAVCE